MKNTNITIEKKLIATISGHEYRDLTEEATNQNGEKYDKKVYEDEAKTIVKKDYSSVQIQTVIQTENGEFKLETFRINTLTKDSEMKALKDKTFEFEGVLERKIDNKTFISVKKIGKEVKTEKPIFDLQNNMIAYIDGITEKEIIDFKTKEHKGYKTVFQVVSLNGTKMTVKNIELMDERADKFKSLIGKKVHFKMNIKEYNGRVSFKINEAPKLVS